MCVWSRCGMPQTLCEDVSTELELVPLPDASMDAESCLTQELLDNSGSGIQQRAPTPLSFHSSQESSAPQLQLEWPPIELSSRRGSERGPDADPFSMTTTLPAGPPPRALPTQLRDARQQYHHHPYRHPGASGNKYEVETSQPVQQRTGHAHERWSTIANPKQHMRILARRRMKIRLNAERIQRGYIHPEYRQSSRKEHAESRPRGPRGTFLPKEESLLEEPPWDDPPQMSADQSMHEVVPAHGSPAAPTSPQMASDKEQQDMGTCTSTAGETGPAFRFVSHSLPRTSYETLTPR